jgi:hypothetical protein
MTDLITPLAELAPLVLLIAIPIVAVRLLDTEDLRDLGPASGRNLAADDAPSVTCDVQSPPPVAGARRAPRPMRPMAGMSDLGWPPSAS